MQDTGGTSDDDTKTSNKVKILSRGKDIPSEIRPLSGIDFEREADSYGMFNGKYKSLTKQELYAIGIMCFLVVLQEF